MKKSPEQSLRDVANMQQDMSSMTVDKVIETAPSIKESEPQVEFSRKELARMEGIPYIEPVRKLKAIGTLPSKWKEKHAKDWEYVKGVFENEACRGEPIKFSYCKWPGDPDCVWEIPANRPVYVPRMIAKHLSGELDEDTGLKCMEYHSFKHIEKAAQSWRRDDFAEQFSVTGTFTRGKFRALGAFS